jgi:hypothetical protein
VNDNSLPANIAGCASETALVNGVRIHYWVGGNPSGPPVLLWHGFPGTSYVWNKVIPILAAAGYEVLAPDGRNDCCECDRSCDPGLRPFPPRGVS